MQTIELEKAQWLHVVNLAELGARTMVANLSSQPGQLKQVGEISSAAATIIEQLQKQLGNGEPKED